MEYNKLIAEMHTGDDVEGFYVLKDAFLKTTAAGKPFLSGVLADRSGTIDLKVWDYSGPIGANPADTGRIVKIRGQVSEFKGAPQLTAGRIRMADGNDQYDVSALVPVAPIDPDERLQEIRDQQQCRRRRRHADRLQKEGRDGLQRLLRRLPVLHHLLELRKTSSPT